ncbi:hypothetical protein ACFFHJ_30030 [Planotetraspora thailandica]|uniref:hypothetical protein n=1 Tax=Planotetraspora thailandica TaxID=487172 RepID=UPI00195193F0|nr:hypothetical protein [Planotetraspora thailandica]
MDSDEAISHHGLRRGEGLSAELPSEENSPALAAASAHHSGMCSTRPASEDGEERLPRTPVTPTPL